MENQQVLAQGAFCNANLLKKPKFLGRKYARHTLNGIDKLSSIDVNNQWPDPVTQLNQLKQYQTKFPNFDSAVLDCFLPHT